MKDREAWLLQSMESQRIRHDFAMEQQSSDLKAHFKIKPGAGFGFKSSFWCQQGACCGEDGLHWKLLSPNFSLLLFLPPTPSCPMSNTSRVSWGEGCKWSRGVLSRVWHVDSLVLVDTNGCLSYLWLSSVYFLEVSYWALLPSKSLVSPL